MNDSGNCTVDVSSFYVRSKFYVRSGQPFAMARRIKQEWTTLSVTKGLLFRLKSVKKPGQAYHEFISCLLDEYGKLYEQNKSLTRRLYMNEPSLEDQLKHECPPLEEAQDFVEVSP